MTIKAVVFDIGGVLEITPRLGVSQKWESRLGLAPGQLDERMAEREQAAHGFEDLVDVTTPGRSATSRRCSPANARTCHSSAR